MTTDYLEGIAAFEAAGGRFSLNDGHVRVTFPKERQGQLKPVLSLLRAHKLDVERWVIKREKIHSFHASTPYGEKTKEKTEGYQGSASYRSPQPPPEECEPRNSITDIEVALRIEGYLAGLSAYQSATASEIAEVFHGRQCTLNHVIGVYHICEELRGAQILIRGRDGYGYQLSNSLKGTAR